MAIAVLLMAVAMSLVPLGDTAGKLLVADYGVSPFMVAWSRFALGAAMLAPFVVGAPGLGRALVDWRIILRALLIVGGISAILTALRTEPLANVFGAFFIGPILSYFLSALLLGERLTGVRTFLLFVGFAGVLLVVQPGSGMSPGLGFAVLAGVFYGGYLTASRWLTAVAPPRILMFAQLVAGAAVLAPAAALAGWPGAATGAGLTGTVGALLALSALASLCGNLLLLLAYGRAPASRMAPFVYLQLPAATLLGWAVFGDLPGPVALAGLALLVASGLASLATRERA